MRWPFLLAGLGKSVIERYLGIISWEDNQVFLTSKILSDQSLRKKQKSPPASISKCLKILLLQSPCPKIHQRRNTKAMPGYFLLSVLFYLENTVCYGRCMEVGTVVPPPQEETWGSNSGHQPYSISNINC